MFLNKYIFGYKLMITVSYIYSTIHKFQQFNNEKRKTFKNHRTNHNLIFYKYKKQRTRKINDQGINQYKRITPLIFT